MSKKELLLSQVIVEYLRYKEPIGSESLKHSMNAKFSSATIRNYFKILAQEGLLSQPHISSGRVPTISALKSYWYQHIDAKSLYSVSCLEDIKKACFEHHIFCILSLEQSNRFKEMINVENKYLILMFDQIGISLPFSSHLERFLNELKGLDIIDMRKIAHQVCAYSLLKSLESVQTKSIHRFCMGAIADICQSSQDESILFSIVDGRVFDSLENGVYFEEVLPKGYLAVMQEVNFANQPTQKARMCCVGALDRDFTHFYENFILR
ncbi:HrcA family transcriptional regulator [Helicobacter sp. MIT 05-5293]|uniref:HrcA family transcriptional regulator n=1 Tax=Helicobacter sp. MIT 05-5293 TaxID=1548149 RepID=UPI00051DE66B|nr:HrcA family transcriptional regulator [Helicobacter sp. MIT 05-5293]TLD81043.1 HrcA family transcriptional regulator [Helicobacter sp. MIT 05-5293]